MIWLKSHDDVVTKGGRLDNRREAGTAAANEESKEAEYGLSTEVDDDSPMPCIPIMAEVVSMNSFHSANLKATHHQTLDKNYRRLSHLTVMRNGLLSNLNDEKNKVGSSDSGIVKDNCG